MTKAKKHVRAAEKKRRALARKARREMRRLQEAPAASFAKVDDDEVENPEALEIRVSRLEQRLQSLSYERQREKAAKFAAAYGAGPDRIRESLVSKPADEADVLHRAVALAGVLASRSHSPAQAWELIHQLFTCDALVVTDTCNQLRGDPAYDEIHLLWARHTVK